MKQLLHFVFVLLKLILGYFIYILFPLLISKQWII